MKASKILKNLNINFHDTLLYREFFQLQITILSNQFSTRSEQSFETACGETVINNI